MSKYIIAFDQGTTSCRVLLINHEAQIIAIEQKEFTQIFPKSGWVEHDPEEIWSTQFEVFENLINNNHIDLSDILSIGITNQRETTVVWDKLNGKPIYNAIVWQDRRTSDFCSQLKIDHHENYIKENTGLVADAYFSGPKINWILDNVVGARDKANKNELCFGTIDTWLIWNMSKGKCHVTDFTNASRTMIFNIQSLQWDDHLLSILNIPKSMLPSVNQSSSHFGYFEYKNVQIPIGGVAGDQQAALFGQACFEKGMAKNTYGTGCFMLMNIGSEYIASQNGLLTTLACDKNGGVCYALEGSVFIAGAGIQWLRDGLKIIKKAKETEQICYELSEEHDVVVIPAFAGLGAPYWDMYARGAIFGLTRGSSDKHIIKATVDSIAYQTKDVINAMQEDTHTEMKELKVDGGACANNYLMQFQSDILQANVERPTNIETTAIGAAYLAGMHAGIWNAEMIIVNRKIDKVFSPKLSKENATKLYDNWSSAVSRIRVKH
jgi:glycerol kinase